MCDTEFLYGDILPVGVCSYESVKDGLLECRAKGRIPENAKSVIVYLFPYYLGEKYYENSNISKYAVPGDYHITAKSYLEKATEDLCRRYPHNSFAWFCDNSPVKEVKAALACGLGVLGRNSLLINEKYGSFCFIGEIITDKEFECENRDIKYCTGCGMCEKLCPGNALINGTVEKEKCFSYITQKKGELSVRETDFIKNNGCIWGCDICQNVCPMNKNISVSPVKEFFETAKPSFCKGDSIENRAFSWRGEKVINRNSEILL